MHKNEVQNGHFWAGDVKPAFFNFAPLASPACGEMGPPVCVFIQQATTSNKHFTEAKTSPLPAGVSKSGKLFFDGEPWWCPG